MSNKNETVSMADQYLFRVVEMFLQKEEPTPEEMAGLLREIVIYLQESHPHHPQQNPTDED